MNKSIQYSLKTEYQNWILKNKYKFSSKKVDCMYSVSSNIQVFFNIDIYTIHDLALSIFLVFDIDVISMQNLSTEWKIKSLNPVSHNGLKSGKNVYIHVFNIFLTGAAPKEYRIIFQNTLFFGLLDNLAITRTNIIYCTIFPFFSPQCASIVYALRKSFRR